MALTFNLTDDTLTYNLHSKTSYVLRTDGTNMGTARQDIVWGESASSHYDALAAYVFRNRVWDVEVDIRATTLDGWVTAYRNIQTMLYRSLEYWRSKGSYGTRCYLDVSLNGMTNTTRYDVMAGDVDIGQRAWSRLMTITTAPIALGVPVRLTTKPFGRSSALTTVTSGTLGNNGSSMMSVGATAATGDYTAPVRVRVSSTGNDIRGLVLWRRSRGDITKYKPDLNLGVASSSYFATSTIDPANTSTVIVADTTAIGGDARDFKSITALSTALTSAITPAVAMAINANVSAYIGTHRVFMRGQMRTAPAPWGVRLSYGGQSGTDFANTMVATGYGTTLSDYCAIDLGTVRIPARDIPSTAGTSGIFRMQLQMGWSATGGVYRVDSLLLVPVDDDVLDLKFPSNVASGNAIIVDHIDARPGIAIQASDNSPYDINYTLRHNTMFMQPAGKASLWGYLLFDGPENQMNSSDSVVITADWYPQYAGFA